MHRERKRWKKAARSLHAEVFSNWFDNTDRYVHDHEVRVLLGRHDHHAPQCSVQRTFLGKLLCCRLGLTRSGCRMEMAV